MSNHRFVTAGQGYYTRTYCEWCGFVSFYSNDGEEKQKEREQELARNKSCPSTPTYVTVQPTHQEQSL